MEGAAAGDEEVLAVGVGGDDPVLVGRDGVPGAYSQSWGRYCRPRERRVSREGGDSPCHAVGFYL